MNRSMNILRRALFGAALVLAAGAVLADTVDETRSAAPDARIQFGGVTGDFEIVGHDANELRITGELGDDVEELVIEGDENHWRIKLEMKEGNVRWGMNRQTSDLRLMVPRGSDVDAQVVSADLTVRELDGPAVDVQSVSGDIELSGVAAAEVSAQSVSGDIGTDGAGTEVNRLQSVSGDLNVTGTRGRIEIQSVSGDIEITGDAVGEFDAETVSGDVEARLRPEPRARLSVTSHSGDIDLYLPGGTPLRIEAETFSGSIDSAFGGEIQSGRGPGEKLSLDADGAAVELEASTFSGNLRIRTLN